jgi:hypothetical protein
MEPSICEKGIYNPRVQGLKPPRVAS